MIDVPTSFRAMPRWWSDEPGRAWLDDLPGLVTAQCGRWGLAIDGAPLHGSNALVVPVRRGTTPVALRMAPPGDDVAAESDALRHWAGRGTVQLVDADVEHRAMLLERLDSSRTLIEVPLLDAVEILAGLVRTMAVPAPDSVVTTRGIAHDHTADFEREWDAVGRPVPASQLAAAVDCAAWLAGRPSDDVSVDGDLHFAQVLAGRRTPWVVVDPVLLRGDPEYDLGRILWSRLDELDDDGVATAFHRFVETADVPQERARSWIVVRSMSYLVYGLARGLTEDPPRCVRLLDLFC